jgi:ubiquinone/menaquinone biosynthesis C-methylase UbiE
MENLYASNNPFIRFAHGKRLELIKRLVGENKGRLLDCGCGEGHLLSQVNGIEYGVDLSDVSLERARERNPDADIRKADICSLPFDDELFEIVICSEVLEHIDNYRKAISEIVRVAKSGGRIIITVPNERNWTIGRLAMLRFPIRTEEHINSFKYEDIVECVGFAPRKVIYVPLNINYQLALTQIFEFEKPKKK